MYSKEQDKEDNVVWTGEFQFNGNSVPVTVYNDRTVIQEDGTTFVMKPEDFEEMLKAG